MEYTLHLFNPAIKSLYAFIQRWLTLIIIIQVCKKKNLNKKKNHYFCGGTTSNYA